MYWSLPGSQLNPTNRRAEREENSKHHYGNDAKLRRQKWALKFKMISSKAKWRSWFGKWRAPLSSEMTARDFLYTFKLCWRKQLAAKLPKVAHLLFSFLWYVCWYLVLYVWWWLIFMNRKWNAKNRYPIYGCHRLIICINFLFWKHTQTDPHKHTSTGKFFEILRKK